jgi:hypothetical protein
MFCEKCNYSTANKSNFQKHLKTKKHLTVETKKCTKCDKTYKTRQSLWKHQQNCKDTNQLLIKLIQQNNELQKQVIQMSNTTYVQNIQTNFNLNIFLNEKCKDAVNITDFVDSLKVREKDIEETGNIGFIDGISKIFIRGLQELELHKRPIHCSDIKREIIYIKDQNIWEKEDEEHEKLKKAITTLTTKNTKTIVEWQKNNPSFMTFNSKKNDQYLTILSNNYGGVDENEKEDNYKKIIKKLAKTTFINKNI